MTPDFRRLNRLENLLLLRREVGLQKTQFVEELRDKVDDYAQKLEKLGIDHPISEDWMQPFNTYFEEAERLILEQIPEPKASGTTSPGG